LSLLIVVPTLPEIVLIGVIVVALLELVLIGVIVAALLEHCKLII